MGDGDVLHGEVNGITGSGDAFPASITVNIFRLGGEDFLHLIIRNITQQKAMERYWREEKTKAEEMNVTLRNVMKAIDRDKDDFEVSIAQKVITSIFPSLQNLAAEDNRDIRDMSENITTFRVLRSVNHVTKSNCAGVDVNHYSDDEILVHVVKQ